VVDLSSNSLVDF